MKTSISQHPRRGLDNFKIISFQSANALRKLHSEVDFGLGNGSLIEDALHILGTSYQRDIFKCIQFFLAHCPFKAHLDCEPVNHADSEGRRI